MEQLRQLSVSGLVNGSEYALLGLAFGLIYSVARRFHYSLSLTFTLAALTVALLAAADVPLLLAVTIGLVAAIASGVLVERWIYRPIADSSTVSASTLNVFVASLGLAIAGENLIRLVFSSQARTYAGLPDSSVSIAGARIDGLGIALVVTAALVTISVSFLVSHTAFGRMARATQSNAELAGLLGVRIQRIYIWAFAVGSLVVGLAGIFEGARHAVLPDMGVRPVFYAFLVAFLANPTSRPWKFWFVGVALGIGESILGLWMPGTVSQVVVFSTLFVIVAARALKPVLERASIILSHRRDRSALGLES